MTVNRDEVTQTRIRTTTFATTNHHGHRSTPPPAANQRGDSSHFTVKPHSGRRSHRHQPYSSCVVFVSFRSGVMRARRQELRQNPSFLLVLIFFRFLALRYGKGELAPSVGYLEGLVSWKNRILFWY
ncbi:unnamed protein product [Brassica rapa subsp. trilocularis]